MRDDTKVLERLVCISICKEPRSGYPIAGINSHLRLVKEAFSRLISAKMAAEPHLLQHDKDDRAYERPLDKFKRIDGPWSWIMCVLFASCNLLMFGCVKTYGILFPSILNEFNSGRAITAIPGSLGNAFGIFGPIIGRICDRFGCRKTMMIGGLCCGLALLISSFAPVILLLVVSFGLSMAIGITFVHFSSILSISTYFEKQSFEALALVLAGPTPGLIIMTPIVQNLNETFGWRTTLKFMASFAIVPVLAAIMMRVPKDVKEKRNENDHEMESRKLCICSQLFDFSALKIKAFALATFIYAIVALGHEMPFAHLGKFCDDIGISSKRSSWLYFTIGISSSASRLVVGKFGKAACWSLSSILLLGIIFLALGNFLLPSVSHYYQLILYCVGYGIGDGFFNTSVATIIIDCLPVENRGGGFGLALFFCGISYVTGPILSGFIADVSGSYNSAFYTAACLEILGAGLCVVLRYTKSPTYHKEELDNSFDTEKFIIRERETVL